MNNCPCEKEFYDINLAHVIRFLLIYFWLHATFSRLLFCHDRNLTNLSEQYLSESSFRLQIMCTIRKLFCNKMLLCLFAHCTSDDQLIFWQQMQQLHDFPEDHLVCGQCPASLQNIHPSHLRLPICQVFHYTKTIEPGSILRPQLFL